MSEIPASDRTEAAQSVSPPLRKDTSRQISIQSSLPLSSDTTATKSLSHLLSEQKEWSKAIIFDQNANILASTFEPREDEIPAFIKLYNKREDAIASGMTFLQEHYEVHRYHIPAIYGRRGDPFTDNSKGIAIYRVESSTSKLKIYCLITYASPTVSGRAVPQLRDFCKSIVSNAC